MATRKQKTSISYLGDQVQETLAASVEVAQAIVLYCAEAVNATVKVYTEPRTGDGSPLEWSLSISSPAGRQTVTVTQRIPLGAVRFSPQ